MDIQGKVLQMKKLNYSDQSRTTSISIGNLTPGIYILRSEGMAWKIMVR
jgi:hypothetical protein